MKTMNDLFLHFLQDIYYAEKAAAKSLNKVAKVIQDDELKALVANGREHANAPIERLDRVFAAAGKKPRAKSCAAMNGLIEEVQEAIDESSKGPVLDAAMIAGLQGMKHYEITRYGSIKAFAVTLGYHDAIPELEALIEAARADDHKLTEIAESHANQAANAVHAEDEEDNDGPSDEPDEKEPSKVKKAAPSKSAPAKSAPAKSPAMKSAPAKPTSSKPMPATPKRAAPPPPARRAVRPASKRG